MEPIYQNAYGTVFKVEGAPNPECTFQMVIDSIGIFMSEADLHRLLNIVRDSDRPCYCNACGGKKCRKIWAKGPLHELKLKLDDQTLPQLEDLILGTRFILNMDDTLNQYRIE
ncbi:MAG: hypothetical protein AAGA86_00070 [Bacteroidota bacterium]